MSLEKMRQTYDQNRLDIGDTDPDPAVQFQAWFEEITAVDAPDWFEPNAMVLATAQASGPMPLAQVSSRVVLLKGVDPSPFQMTFYTNYGSAKSLEMLANPSVSLCFYWAPLQRQVRVEGSVRKSDREKSVRYFQTRPLESQIGAAASPQSEIVEDRQWLEQRMEQLRSQATEGKSVDCPENWGGFEVSPTKIEFWQGRPGRLHDRIVYRLNSDLGWERIRLAP